jgi:hypothetical protein
VDPTQINNILIMENHSAFIGAKKALTAGINIFSQDFDTVIYGQGKRIIRSFSFLEELLGFESAENNSKQRQQMIKRLNIYYAGDLDPEGLAIYTALKDKYPEFEIRLLGEYYQLLLEESEKFYSLQKRQNKNEEVLKRVLAEFKEQNLDELAAELKQAWENYLRLPQELITLEVYKNWRKRK